MKVIYSNFDSIYFAVKGALNPAEIERLKLYKARAEKEGVDQPVPIGNGSLVAYIKQTGQKGYAFVLDMGFDAQTISLSTNLVLTNWNGFVKIRAMSLALKGYQKALQDALDALKQLGFEVKGISVNRVDYAIDVLTPRPIELDAANIVTHSRRLIKAHYDPIVEISRSRKVQSLTIGKMPGSQITIYDKLAEVKAKRNFHWFKIWSLNQNSEELNIRRVEIRAAKTTLKAHNITSIDALISRIGAVYSRLIAATRYVTLDDPDTNRSRAANHPLWDMVEYQIENGILSNSIDGNVAEMELTRRDIKTQEYKKLILGLLISLAYCCRIPFENITDVIQVIADELNDMERKGSRNNEVYGKKYVKVRDRLRFR